jgi:hypothetical protein
MDGTWERIWRAFLGVLDEQGQPDWSRAFLDGSFVPAKKQLCLMPRGLNIWIPSLLMFDHRVQDDQELAHAGRQGHFPGLARPTKAVVKGLDYRVIPAGRQSRHIEGSADPSPSAPDHPLAPEAATVSIERGHPYQRGNLMAVQGAQFGELGQEGDGYYWANPRDTTQQVVFLTPQGALPNGVV